MPILNSRKILIILFSISIVCLIILIATISLELDKWFWILGSLSIGFLIVGGPLLRAYLREKKREELGPAIESSIPAKSCSHCGYEIPPKQLYCDNCGQKAGK